MKKIFLLVVILSAFGYAQMANPVFTKKQRDSLNTKLAEIAFADSFANNMNRTSIAQIKEVSEYEPVIQDSSMLLYNSGTWSIFDLGQALVALAQNTVTITYPDANTIDFNNNDQILLEQTTLAINGNNELSVVDLSAFIKTGIDSIRYGVDSVVVPHGVGSAPSFVSIQLMSDGFGFRTWVNVIGATTFSVKRNSSVYIETPSTYIKFRWLAYK